MDLVNNANYEKVGCLLFGEYSYWADVIYIHVQLSLVYNSGPFGFGKRTGNCVCHYDLKAEV
jgi:hypothetical protein